MSANNVDQFLIELLSSDEEQAEPILDEVFPPNLAKDESAQEELLSDVDTELSIEEEGGMVRDHIAEAQAPRHISGELHNAPPPPPPPPVSAICHTEVMTDLVRASTANKQEDASMRRTTEHSDTAIPSSSHKDSTTHSNVSSTSSPCRDGNNANSFPFEAAVEAESRLAQESQVDAKDGRSSMLSRFDAKELLVASIISQLDSLTVHKYGEEEEEEEEGTDAPPLTSTQPSAAVMGHEGAARAFISPHFEKVLLDTTHTPTVITKYLALVAMGTKNGAVYVLLPGATGQPHMAEASTPKLAGDGVTSLALGRHSGGLLLLSGHESGALALWELKIHHHQAGGPLSGLLHGGVSQAPPSSSSASHPQASMAWSLSKLLPSAHGSTVITACILDGGPVTWAVTADQQKRLVIHNLSRVLSVTAQALSSFTRQLTGGLSPLSTGIRSSSGGTFSNSQLLTLQPIGGREPGAVVHCTPLPTPLPPVHNLHSPSIVGDRPATVFLPDRGHFVLLVCTNAVFIGLISLDGRLIILHVFLSPSPSAAPSIPPHAAWQLLSSPAGMQSPGVHCEIAVAWGTEVSAYQCSLAAPSPPPAHGSTGTAPTPRLPTPVLKWTGRQPHPIFGLVYFDGGQLLVAQQDVLTSTTQLVIRPATGEGVEESLVIQESAGDHPVFECTAHGGGFYTRLSGWGEQAVLMTGEGVRVIGLLQWQQRMSALVSMDKMEEALIHGIRLYHSCTTQTVAEGGAHTHAWPSEHASSGTAHTVARHTLVVLTAYLDAFWKKESRRQQQQQQHRREVKDIITLADISISACLLLQQKDALFSEVYTSFREAGHVESFLLQIRPYIERGQLPSLPPDVVQDLVEVSVRQGNPESVERCVLSLDVMSMDLNQIIPLCLKYNLYSALIDIFSRALQDLTTAPSLLLVASAATQNRALGYKLLVFLHCCLSGREFPPGRRQHVQREAEGDGGRDSMLLRAHGAFFLLFLDALSVWECWMQWAGKVKNRTTSVVLEKLPIELIDPHPALRYLFSLDAQATLFVLRQGLVRWDAFQTDIAEVLSGTPTAMYAHTIPTTSLTLTQVTVDALFDILLHNSCPNHSEEDRAYGLSFIAEHIAAGRATAGLEQLSVLLEYLAGSSSDMEDTFTTVAIGNNNDTRMKKELLPRALELAKLAHFFKAQAAILDAQGTRGDALSCLANDIASPESAFKYIQDVYDDPHVPPGEKEAFEREIMTQRAAQLIRLDAGSMTKLIMERCPDKQQHVLNVLAGQKDLQFAYLKSLSRNRTYSELEWERQPMLLTNNEEVASMFVDLLCLYEPPLVLPFLQGNDAYNVDVCLQHCLSHGVGDGAAFLLERRGDVHGALKMHLESLDRANRRLATSIIESHDGAGHALQAAKASLDAAASLCLRCSQDLHDSRSTNRLWFDVLDTYIALVRELRHQQHEDEIREGVVAAQKMLASLMEEFVGLMASGGVPLSTIADVLVAKHGGDRFGDFRSTMMGLMGACTFEVTMLKSASRIMGADGADILRRGYRLCSLPAGHIVSEQTEDS